MGNAKQTSRSIGLIMAALMVLTAVGVTLSTVADIDLGTTTTGEIELTPDEAAYYEYVSPRVDALVVEMTSVSEMVDVKSRNVVALAVAGNKIERLSDEIRTWAQDHPVPDRFAAVHQELAAAIDTATGTFGAARTALTTGNFSRMTDLVPEFHGATDALYNVQRELATLTGHDIATPPANAGSAHRYLKGHEREI